VSTSRSVSLLMAMVMLGAGAGACDGGSADTGGAGAGGRGGAAGSAGAAGRGGAGGTAGGAGAGGMTAAACPAAVPTTAGSCNTAGSCYYEDCAGAGRTIATCTNGNWIISTAACASVICPGPSTLTCQAGQLCMVRAGGALLVECIANPCGTGAISCNCVQSCTGVCTVIGTAQTGVTINCNTCPQGGCP
jgi:hypothetical protein